MSKSSNNKNSTRRSALKRSQESQRPKNASFRPSPFSEESRKKREKERRRSSLKGKKPLIFLSIIAAILVIITLLALVPGFTIETIEIDGAYRLDEQGVYDGISHHLSKHFFYKIGGDFKSLLTLHYKHAEEKLLAESPLLDTVDVYFSYPGKINVDLKEKTEVMCVRVPGGYALVDKDLTVIELLEEASEIFPSVEQIVLKETAEPGVQLQTDQTERLQKSINITAEIIRSDISKIDGEQLLPLIRHIIWQDNNTFFLHIPSTQGGMIRVKLDDNRYLQDRLALLSDLIFVEQFADKSAGELDMTGTTIHFRPDKS